MVPSSFMISQMTRGGVQAGLARDVDRGLGMAGADQGAAFAGHERKDVAGGDDVVAAAFGVDGDGDGVGAVVRRRCRW